MGVAIRKGAAKPDLDTTEAFKQALLKAKTIAYSDGGLTGVYIKGLFERLGIAEQIKSKTKHGRGAEMVAEGKAEIGLTQISEILPVAARGGRSAAAGDPAVHGVPGRHRRGRRSGRGRHRRC